MIDVGSVTTDTTTLTSGPVRAADDHSYSRFPTQTAAGDDSPAMSFGDFLDMVNPLQHIPVVSTIYRAVTGSTINPVSRIAGDALYGAAFGLASAGISAVGAIGDEIYAAHNDGQGGAATLMAALFGDDDKPASVQLASLDVSQDATHAPLPTSNQTANLTSALPATPSSSVTPTLQPSSQAVAANSPNLVAPAQVTPATAALAPALPQPSPTPFIQLAVAPPSSAATAQNSLASVQAAVTPPPSSPGVQNLAMASPTLSSVGPGLPLDRSKQAYGGVMDESMMQAAQQNQALALAIASGRSNLQAQHDIRNSRFAVNTPSHATMEPSTPSSASPSAPQPNLASALSTALSSPNSSNADLLARANLAASASAVAPVPVLSAAAQNALTPPLPSLQTTLAQTSLSSSSHSSGLLSTANTPASMQSMIGNLRSMKGLAQYRSTAQSIPAMGASVDVMN